MVYRGRPSTACHLCRTRRIKCDTKRPGCTQCLRLSVNCPGYRSLVDVLFRNENEAVIQKARASYLTPARKLRQEPKPAVTEKFSAYESCVGTPETIPYRKPYDGPIMLCNLGQPIEDIGIANFMASCIPGSRFDYLPQLYRKSSFKSPLTTTIYAASIATLSQELDAPHLMETARRCYVKSLAMTKIALEDPYAATQDSTLASVLLLGLFEGLVWDGLGMSTNWRAHTAGALALVKLRGPQQFQTEIGRRLFIQVGNSVRVNCIQRRLRVPPELDNLVSVATPFFEDGDPKLAFAKLTSEVASYMSEMDNICDFEAIDMAISLDERLSLLTSNLSGPWSCTEIRAENLYSDTYSDTVHQYRNHHTAQLWNSCRMLRILLNEAIYGYTQASTVTCPSSDSSDALTSRTLGPLQLNAFKIIGTMATEICASIPQFLCRNSHPLSRAYTSSLLWPLSAVRGASLAPEPAREYAVHRLRYLGTEMKLKKAVKIAGASHNVEALKDGLCILYLA